MDWLRLYTEILDDPKIAKLSEKSFKVFIFLLCFAQELNENGVINRSLQDISWRLRVPETQVKKSINELIKLEILAADERISFLNWSKRQYKSDDSSERWRKKRERDKNGNCDMTRDNGRDMTRDMGVATAVKDTDTDTEKSNIVNTPISPEPEIDPAEFNPKKTPLKKPKTEPTETEDEKSELRETVKRVIEKFPHFPVNLFLGNHTRGDPELILQTLKELLLDGTNIDNPLAYCEAVLKIKTGRVNARQEEAEHEQRKRPTGTEMEVLGAVMQRAMATRAANPP